MPTLFWDASGLAKRYALETGSSTAAALSTHVPALQEVTTLWGYTETYALLLRKRNGGLLSPALFAAATSLLRNEVFLDGCFELVAVTDTDILGSITHIQRHNLNSTDAALLATLLRYKQATGETCVLIAADNRFYRSALAEGLPAINPELLSAADVPTFFASLSP